MAAKLKYKRPKINIKRNAFKAKQKVRKKEVN